MTTLDQWRALLTDVDKATGPNFALEQRIGDLVYPPDAKPWPIPAFTASLDAVVALVEREMPERAKFLMQEAVQQLCDSTDKSIEALCRFLLAAFIRARIAEMEQEAV